MVPSRITDSDMIILQSVESYLKSLGTPINQSPQEKLIVTQQARDYLYSDIVQRIPRVASYLMTADMESDTVAQGLWFAISKHIMDPAFINLLMQYLSRNKNEEENAITGALLTKLLNKYMQENAPKETTKSKKGDSDESSKFNAAPVQHIINAIDYLIGGLANVICTRCVELTHANGLAIAACIAMNNKDTISEMIASDMPITADLFEIVADPSNIIKGALLIEKSAFLKMTDNQRAFVDSLTRWVYKKLDQIPIQTAYQFLVSVYGAIKVKMDPYLININDCGMQFANLRAVTQQIADK